MITNRTSITARAAQREAERCANLAESLFDLYRTVAACESFERSHPFTVATIRSMATRSPRS